MLSVRAAHISEWMDRADCDAGQLNRTYRYFGLVNTAVASWSLLYRRFLTPVLEARRDRTIRLLDIGCGGGDVLSRLLLRARRDGFTVAATGIDPDGRAVAYARSQPALSGVHLMEGTADMLAVKGEQFDIVLSNHLLHHLPDAEVTALCETSRRLTTGLALHNDIHRHPLAYAGFPLIGGLFPNSFILPDGMRSIRRSFTPTELSTLVPAGWEVRTAPPFRCLLVYRP